MFLVDNKGHGAEKVASVFIMQVRLNGKPSDFGEGIDVLKLLEELGINPKTVVIELNRKIVNRSQYSITQLKAQDEIEVVQFVGGGSVG